MVNNPFDVIDSRLSNIETLLLDLKHQPKPADDPTPKDKLLTIEEAADYLFLSVPTLYGKVSRGELPVMKRTKRLYFSQNELEAYIRQGRKKTVSELGQEAESYLKKERVKP